MSFARFLHSGALEIPNPDVLLVNDSAAVIGPGACSAPPSGRAATSLLAEDQPGNLNHATDSPERTGEQKQTQKNNNAQR
jgi:hypothetical protein